MKRGPWQLREKNMVPGCMLSYSIAGNITWRQCNMFFMDVESGQRDKQTSMRLWKKPWRYLFSALGEIPLEINLILFSSNTMSLTHTGQLGLSFAQTALSYLFEVKTQPHVMQTNTAGRQRHEGCCTDPFGKPGSFHGMLGQITSLCSFQSKTVSCAQDPVAKTMCNTSQQFYTLFLKHSLRGKLSNNTINFFEKQWPSSDSIHDQPRYLH